MEELGDGIRGLFGQNPFGQQTQIIGKISGFIFQTRKDDDDTTAKSSGIKKDNSYNLSDEELQANMNKIYRTGVEELLSK